MIDTTTTFSVDIEETGGEDAASSLEALRQKVVDGQGSLREMLTAMRALKSGTSVSIDAFKQLRDQISAQKESIAAAQAGYVELGGNFQSAASRAAELAEAAQALKDAQSSAAEDAKALAEATKASEAAATEQADALRQSALAAIETGQSFANIGEAAAAIEAGGESIREMQAQLKLLESSASADAGAIADLTAKIEEQQAALSGAQQAFVDFGGNAQGALKMAGPASEEASSGIEGMLGPLSRVGGRMVGVSRSALTLVKSLGKAGVAGLAVGAAIVVAVLATALIAGAIALTKFALTSSDAARTSALLAAGMAGSVAGGVALQATVTKLGRQVPLTRDELMKMGGELAKSGLKGKALDDALTKAALKAAKLKFGPDFAKQMLSLSSQSENLSQDVADIFGGANIEPFLKGLHEVGSLLDENTVSGRALRVAVKAIMDPVFAGISKVAPYAKAFFQGMIIATLMLVVVVLKIKKALSDAFGGSATSNATGLKIAMYAGYAAVAAFVGVLILLAAIMAIVAVAFIPLAILGIIVVAAILLIVAAIGAVVYAFYKLYEAGVKAGEFLANLDFASIGSDIIDGLVNAITAGATKVISAVSNLGRSALGALRSIFDSHSPSKAFGRLGDTAPQGLVGSFEDGESDVEGAAASLGRAATRGTRKGMSDDGDGGQRGGNGSGPRVVIEKIEIHGVQGAEDPGFINKVAQGVELALAARGLAAA